ncbi:hypothetical protein HYV58_00560, partial [Candidatus Peregrinibacteria bacterium]|nr:hypothetical protein [Candidatus Peregrinibacteria bacterium]
MEDIKCNGGTFLKLAKCELARRARQFFNPPALFFLAFVIPLAYSYIFFFPYLTPKVAIFFISTEVLFFFLLLKRFPQVLSQWRSPLVYFLSAQMLVSFVSALQGENFLQSFFGFPNRWEGVLMLFHFFLFFLLLISLQDRFSYEKLLSFSAGVSGVVSLHIILQYVLPLFAWYAPPLTPSGTIGNITFASQYLLLHAFALLHLWDHEKIPASFKVKILRIMLLALQAAAMIFMARRGILLALGAAGIVLFFRRRALGNPAVGSFVKKV